ncbi:hypothetical protein ACFWM3_14325 [Gottfriedia sp. NPDC058432]|uniref:hypothetical protein n=1 Tax=Gottfriedia sp. NPDC058432 TaxID=3346497 RepID=UPI0036472ADE
MSEVEKWRPHSLKKHQGLKKYLGYLSTLILISLVVYWIESYIGGFLVCEFNFISVIGLGLSGILQYYSETKKISKLNILILITMSLILIVFNVTLPELPSE